MPTPPDGFALVKPGQTYLGKQGNVYGAGASKRRPTRKTSALT